MTEKDEKINNLVNKLQKHGINIEIIIEMSSSEKEGIQCKGKKISGKKANIQLNAKANTTHLKFKDAWENELDKIRTRTDIKKEGKCTLCGKQPESTKEKHYMCKCTPARVRKETYIPQEQNKT